MVEQAKAMQQRLKEQLALVRVEASTGGGMVTVRMDGTKRVTAVVIEPEVAEDIEMLQDMVRGAVNEASKRVDDHARQKIGSMMGGIVGDLDLPPGLLE